MVGGHRKWWWSSKVVGGQNMGIMVGGENENGRGRKKVVGGQNFEKKW